MTYSQPTFEKPPGKVQAIAIMTLINGILNVIFGFVFTISVIGATAGIGLLCSPVTILPSVLGVFEIIGGAKLMGNPPRKFNVKTIAILEICTIITANVTSLVIGILNLVFYNDPETQAYIESLPS
jgi:hypothetical protein